MVKKVVSTVPSVPLIIISLSLAAASIVMLPELVVRRTAASPIEMSSAAGFVLSTSTPTHLPSEELYLRNLLFTFAVDLSTSSKNSSRVSPDPAPDICNDEIFCEINDLKLSNSFRIEEICSTSSLT